MAKYGTKAVLNDVFIGEVIGEIKGSLLSVVESVIHKEDGTLIQGFTIYIGFWDSILVDDYKQLINIHQIESSTDVLKYCIICNKLRTDRIWCCEDCNGWYHNSCGVHRKNASKNTQPKCHCQVTAKPTRLKKAKKSKK